MHIYKPLNSQYIIMKTHGNRKKKMKLLLVLPTTTFKNGTPYKTRSRWIMGLALPYMAGLTPRWVDVEFLDDCYSEVNYDGSYDLVGLSVTISTATRAYQIAGEFRKRE
jgi:hypothetical protein